MPAVANLIKVLALVVKRITRDPSKESIGDRGFAQLNGELGEPRKNSRTSVDCLSRCSRSNQVDRDTSNSISLSQVVVTCYFIDEDIDRTVVWAQRPNGFVRGIVARVVKESAYPCCKFIGMMIVGNQVSFPVCAERR